MKLTANEMKQQQQKFVKVQLAWHASCRTDESIQTTQVHKHMMT